MAAGLCMGGVFIILFLCSFHESMEGYKGKGYLLPLARMARFMGENLPGKGWREEWLTYTLLIFLGGTVLTFVAGFAMGGSREEEIQKIERPQTTKESRTEDLWVHIEGEEEAYEIPLELTARQLSTEQKESVLKQALVEIEEKILGENTSADEVRTALYLPKSLENGLVSIQWTIDPPDVLGDEGNIEKQVEKEQVVSLVADLDCGGEKAKYEQYIKVVKPIYTPREETLQSILKAIRQADADTALEKELVLPDTIGEKRVRWELGKTNIPMLLCVLTLIGTVGIYLGQTEKEVTKEKQRKKGLLLEYPELLYRLSMLLGAGLTIQGAFQRLGREYKSRRKEKICYSMEEVLMLCTDMEKGVPESTAYEMFGRRCGLPKYMELGSILSQNLRKGSEGLLELLSREAALSMEEQRQMARKLGEEAGTKLLMPMILMLVIVFIILMVPAMMNF